MTATPHRANAAQVAAPTEPNGCALDAVSNDQIAQAANILAELWPPNPHKHGLHLRTERGRKGTEPKKHVTTNDGFPVTPELLRQHLTGEIIHVDKKTGRSSNAQSLGYLPALIEGAQELTNVGIIDLDWKDYLKREDPAADMAADVARILAAADAYGLSIYPERSSRGKGWHFHIFTDRALPIPAMVDALKGVVAGAGLSIGQTETYPMGEHAASRWIITPYSRALQHLVAPGDAKAQKQRPNLGRTYLETVDGQPIELLDALDMIERNDAATLEAFAEEYRANHQPKTTSASTASASQATAAPEALEAFKAALLAAPESFERHDSAQAALNIFKRMGYGEEGRAFLESDELMAVWLTDGSRTPEEWAEELGRWWTAKDTGNKYGFPFLTSQGFDLKAVKLTPPTPVVLELEDALAAVEAAAPDAQIAAMKHVWTALQARKAGEAEIRRVIEDRLTPAVGLGLGVLRKDYADFLKAHASTSKPKTRVGEYTIHGNVFCRIQEHSGPNGEVDTVHIPLGNFSLEILESVSRDDGVERTRHYLVTGTSQDGRKLPEVTVSGRNFDAMNWTTEEWGGAAVPYAGAGQRDHIRVAAHLLSNPVHRTLYTHTGWRHIDGQNVYFHAAGVIGRDDDTPEVQVELDGPLSAYEMPPRPSWAEAAQHLRTFLATLDLAHDRVMAPLLMAVFRAPLGDADFSIHVVGFTGLGKSQLAALMQQASGARMTSDSLPGSWTSTANALEMLAFLAKDEVLVIDDFNPTGSRHDQDRYHAAAERVFRAAGNSSGRGRLRSDGTLRPVKPPQALIISTGEDTPKGQSLRARLFIIELQPGDLDWLALTTAQAAAARGDYASARAGYISWLAADLEQRQATFNRNRATIREALGSLTGHPRTADAAAQLLATWETLREYATDLGFTSDELDHLAARIRRGILTTAEAQVEHHAAADPVQHFFNLLAALITSGAGHLATTQGEYPGEGWGWRTTVDSYSGRESYQPQGPRLGWVTDEGIYLDPETAYARANRLGEAQSESLAITKHTLWKRLAERQLIRTSEEAGKTRTTFKRSVEGVSRRVLVLASHTLPEVGRVGSSPEKDDTQGENVLPTTENGVGRVGNPAEKVGSNNASRAPATRPEGAPV